MARIRKIMVTDVPTLKKEAKIFDAAKLLASDENGCVVILDGRKPVGIVTEHDILSRFVSKNKSMNEKVSRIMSAGMTFMTPDVKLDEAVEIIDTKKFRKYPVIENEELAGLATKRAIIQAVSDNLKLHRSIQNIVLILFAAFEFFVLVLFNYFPPGGSR